MLEKIKEVPFIEESAAVKLTTINGKLQLERTDKVVWASEQTAMQVPEINCYVEADKFFTLLPDIKSIVQTTCLEITLNNGAKYELPFMQVNWETRQMPTDYTDKVNFKITDLMLCTLKNLMKPELQCIYIDSEGAVTCDFTSACISTAVKSTTPFLLPPDVQPLVDGTQCSLKVDDNLIYIAAPTFNIVVTKPTLSADAWWDTLREMLEHTCYAAAATAQLIDGLRRLQLFGDYIAFDGEKAVVGQNYEPFAFQNLENKRYEIEKLSKILTTATSITTSDSSNLILKNESSKFLISPVEEGE